MNTLMQKVTPAANGMIQKVAPSATSMIRMDHTHVLATFHRYRVDSPPNVKRGLVNTICIALEVHAQLEEEIFYPAVRAVSDNEAVRKSVPEHNEMRRLIGALRAMEPTDPGFDDTFMELMRDVIHHVADEETILLPEAERLLPHRLADLGAEMTRRRMQLVAPRTGEIGVNMVRGMPRATLIMATGAVLTACMALRHLRKGRYE
jgi:hemerythrin superfamily protein